MRTLVSPLCWIYILQACRASVYHFSPPAQAFVPSENLGTRQKRSAYHYDTPTSNRSAPSEEVRIPDEQRLYEALLGHYERSVRPVDNSTAVVDVKFHITLNQVVDLDERRQILTTNVFIDQRWTDEKFRWNISEYNGIRTLRVPASYVWLPDTFIFNNADVASTGFMHGVFVSIQHNGSVLWPVPVKLRSSCKVDIAFFPFDDQMCSLKFGSWIYTGECLNFHGSIEDIAMQNYIDNSEWQLVGIRFKKEQGIDHVTRPVLNYTLYMRRRTFYYIFNIIVPCIMLSVLTLLTFWLPATSGEKISLGLSVFLAFSMFMLLIAEEVPATSESVPLIGIYLTTVMTMTSLSVIMAVLVINLYNRGTYMQEPHWLLRKVVLQWMSWALCMHFNLDQLANTIQFSDDEMERHGCPFHSGQLDADVSVGGTGTGLKVQRSPLASGQRSSRRASQAAMVVNRRASVIKRGHDSVSIDLEDDLCQRSRRSSHRMSRSSGYRMTSFEESAEPQNQAIWIKQDSLRQTTVSGYESVSSQVDDLMIPRITENLIDSEVPKKERTECAKKLALARRRRLMCEWQALATIIDRLLFWVFLIGTALAYLLIVILAPYTKSKVPGDFVSLRAFLDRRQSI